MALLVATEAEVSLCVFLAFFLVEFVF